MANTASPAVGGGAVDLPTPSDGLSTAFARHAGGLEATPTPAQPVQPPADAQTQLPEIKPMVNELRLPGSNGNNPLRLLSLDGNGMDATFQLERLVKIMQTFKDEQNLERVPHPCEYFDMIAGSGMGGLAAILLGVLKLSAVEALKLWTTMAGKSLTKRGTNSIYDTPAFESTLKALFAEHGVPSFRTVVQGKEHDHSCKTFVMAMPRDSTHHQPSTTRIRNYLTQACNSNAWKVWEAVRATTAVQGVFEPISVRMSVDKEQVFTASSTIANPIEEMMMEAQQVFGSNRRVSLVLSLAAGVQDATMLQEDDNSSALFGVLGEQAENVHRNFAQRTSRLGLYVRIGADHAGGESSPQPSPNNMQMRTLINGLRWRTAARSLAEINGAVFTSIHRVPIPNLATPFVQRTELQYAMDQILTQHRQSKQSTQLRYLLHGLDGAGKTQMALDFLHRHRSEFLEVFCIDGSSEDTVQTGLARAIQSLGPAYADCTTDDALQQLQYLKNWAILFDNINDHNLDLRKYFPDCSHGVILVTTRSSKMRSLAPEENIIHVQEMKEHEGIELMLSIVNMSQKSETQGVAGELVRELRCFALAIRHAGSFIAVSRDYAAYLSLYRARRLRVSKKWTNPHTSNRYLLAVYTTLDISFRHLGPLAQDFLRLCSRFHHTAIPREMIEVGLQSRFSGYWETKLGPPADWKQDQRRVRKLFLPTEETDTAHFLRDTVPPILSYSLMTMMHQGPQTFYSIHPLVHSWIRDNVDDKNQIRFSAMARRLVASSISKEPPTCGNETTFLASIRPHVRALDCRRASLVDQMHFAHAYYWSGPSFECLELQALIHGKLQDELGPNDELTLTWAHRRAMTLHALGEHSGSEKLHREVFQARRKQLGPHHPHILASMREIAQVLDSMQRYRESLPWHKQVLQLCKERLPAKHPEMLALMNNFANALDHVEKYAESESLHRSVLESYKSVFGPQDVKTLSAMSSLAFALGKNGQYAESEALHRQVLSARSSILGRQHPDTLAAMDDLAGTLVKLGRHTEGEELYRQVLELRKTILGPQHPKTIISINNLAHLLSSIGKYTESVALYESSEKNSSEPQRPGTMDSMRHLATTLERSGRPFAADGLIKEVF